MRFLMLVISYVMLAYSGGLAAFAVWMDFSYVDNMPFTVFSSNAVLTSGHFLAGAGLAAGLAVICVIIGILKKSSEKGESHAP